MSSKFNRVRPSYLKPGVCRPPPPEPLPPYAPDLLYVQANARLRWPKPDGSCNDWSRLGRNIPRITPSVYYGEYACGADVLILRVELQLPQRRISGEITAYTGALFHASATWTWEDLPEAEWWRIQLANLIFRIPPDAQAWFTIWA